MSAAAINIKDCTAITLAGQFLTQQFGPDWFMRIDVSQLNMADHRKCVLGQLTGDCGEWCENVFGSPAAWTGTVFDIRFNNSPTRWMWVEYINDLQDARSAINNNDEPSAEEEAMNPATETATPAAESILVQFEDGYMMWVQALSDITMGIKFKIVER